MANPFAATDAELDAVKYVLRVRAHGGAAQQVDRAAPAHFRTPSTRTARSSDTVLIDATSTTVPVLPLRQLQGGGGRLPGVPVNYSLRLNHRKVYHRKFDLLSESGSLMWQKSLSNVLDLDSFIAILSNMNLVSDFVR